MALLGKDVTVIGPEKKDGELEVRFLVESFRGREALAAPFRYDLTVLSDSPNISAFRVLGRSLTISMNLGTTVRFFNGIVTYFAKIGFTKTHTRYALVLNPKLSRLDYARNCRIFKQASMNEQEADDGAPIQDTLSLVTALLLERDVTDVDNVTEKQGDKNHVVRDRHFCVQYRESDLNFVQRLLEEEGIYYFFTHELVKHNMVLADSMSAHRSKAIVHEPILYLPKENRSSAPPEHFWGLTVAGALYAGKYSVLRGYDHTKTRAPVPVPDAQIDEELAGNPQPAADFEDYDYPGGLCEATQAKAEAKVRSEADRSANHLIEVEGNTMGVGVGDLVKLKPDARTLSNPFWGIDDIKAEYMVTAATYSFTINQHEAGDPGVEDEPFRARYTLMDARQQYRPLRTARKPRIEGPQTAVVVGAEHGQPKEEIYTDKLGRVKVKFDWDRTAGGDMNSSCWVRVSQVWAGQNWGAIHIPRVGQEVVVEFLDGDPDRPLITGRVYSANNPVPYTLPDHRTQSGIKSRSTNGGSPSNFNEIRFEDLKGKEELFIQAEKDENITVKSNQSTSVGSDRSLSVGNNETVSIGSNRTEKVGANEKVDIASNRTETVGADESVTIGANQTLKVGANQSITVGANRTKKVGASETVTIGAASTETIGTMRSVTITAAYQLTVGGAINETVGAAKAEEIGGAKIVAVGAASTESVAGSKSVSAGGSISETAGGKITISAKGNLTEHGKKVAIDADDQITLKCGSATLVLKKNGDVTINGNKISVTADGNLVLKGSKIAEN